MPIMLVLSDITLVQADGLRSHTYITKYLCRKNIMYSPEGESIPRNTGPNLVWTLGGGGAESFQKFREIGEQTDSLFKDISSFFRKPQHLATGHRSSNSFRPHVTRPTLV